MIKILALVGMGGVGKDYVKKEILRRFPEFTNDVVSCTTRPPRENETDGVDYHFLNMDSFLLDLDKKSIIAVSSYNNWLYGTRVDELSIDKVNVMVLDPKRLEMLLEDDSGALNVYPVLVSAKRKERLMNAIERVHENDKKGLEEVCRRFLDDEDNFIPEIPNMWIISTISNTKGKDIELDKNLINFITGRRSINI